MSGKPLTLYLHSFPTDTLGTCMFNSVLSECKTSDFPSSLHIHYLFPAVCTFDSLPHFIPLIEFRDRIDHWKWIGQFYCVLWILVCHHLTWCAGQDRDSEVELLVLCNHWLETLDRALVKRWSIGCGWRF